MSNKVFAGVVLLLWAASMSWLLVVKILPPFYQGEPPNLSSLRRQPLVCWRIDCSEQPVGWAVSQVVPGALETTEIHSRVLLENIPLREMAPRWMSSIIDNVGPIKLDTRNRVALDAFGNLTAFDSKVRLNEMPAVIKMSGRVQDAELLVRIQSGDITHETKYPIPGSAMLGGELMPDAKLVQMYVGRRWQKEVLSPLRSPNRSMELIQAEVVRQDTIRYDGQLTKANYVEYRSLSSAGVAADDTVRAVLWVAEDGTVLRQEIRLLNIKLRFERMQDPKSLQMAARLLDLETVATVFGGE